MKWFECVKECLFMFKKTTLPQHPTIESIQEVRRSAQESVRRAKASLNGENGWFLSVQRRTFADFPPPGVNKDE